MAEIPLSFEELQKVLSGLTGPDLEKAIQKAMLKVGQEARIDLMRYPGPAHSPVIWASEKQRRFYFAMRRKAGLDLEYTRISDPMSQKLRHSWEVKTWENAGAIVGTRVTYAPYVQGEDDQIPQHWATGWRTEADTIEELKSRNVVERIVMAELDSYIKGLKA